MHFLRKLILFGIICLLSSIAVHGKNDSFEGHIAFLKKTHFDTVKINYYIKGNKVRINQYTKDDILLHSLLLDLKQEKVIAIDPERKMYRVLNLKEKNYQNNKLRYQIKKTGNHRIVNGENCYQWRVRDTETKSEVAYWVIRNNFNFMDDVIRLLSKTDKVYLFFSQIQGTNGFFPMLTVERNLLRKERQRIMVQNIDRKKMNESIFQVPSDFVEVSR